MKRPYSTVDTGSAIVELCGSETVVYASRNGSREHEAECCDCWLMRAWWGERIRKARQHSGHM